MSLTVEDDKKYDVPIRSVKRTIDILQAINRHGAMTIAEISRAADVPYPTATRFVLTLIELGVIEKSKRQKKYRPTALSKTLSCGYMESDYIVDLARPHLVELTKTTGWPSAVHMRVGSSMIMLDSTHANTTQTFSDYYPGYSMPITACAAGLAYMAYLPKEERSAMLDQVETYKSEVQQTWYSPRLSDAYFEEIVEAGYSTYLRNPHSKDPGKSSSIGVPIFSGGGQVIGAMTLVFFSSAMKIAEASERYMEDIKLAQKSINADIEDH